MPNSDNQVTLTIDDAYRYTYSGGNKQNGDVENKTGKGPSKIHISLEGASSLEIVDVDFSGTGADNFSFNVNGNKRRVTIDDTCLTDADVKYTVNVVDASNGRNVACDPRITNVRA